MILANDTKSLFSSAYFNSYVWLHIYYSDQYKYWNILRTFKKISVWKAKLFGPYNLRVLSGGANIDIDIQEQKKDELIYDTLKSEYADEVKKGDRIDEEARGLVPNILIVVAILLGAGTTSLFVDVMSVHQSHFPILYALGISFMIISITLVFVILKFLGGEGLFATDKYFQTTNP